LYQYPIPGNLRISNKNLLPKTTTTTTTTTVAVPKPEIGNANETLRLIEALVYIKAIAGVNSGLLLPVAYYYYYYYSVSVESTIRTMIATVQAR